MKRSILVGTLSLLAALAGLSGLSGCEYYYGNQRPVTIQPDTSTIGSSIEGETSSTVPPASPSSSDETIVPSRDAGATATDAPETRPAATPETRPSESAEIGTPPPPPPPPPAERPLNPAEMAPRPEDAPRLTGGTSTTFIPDASLLTNYLFTERGTVHSFVRDEQGRLYHVQGPAAADANWSGDDSGSLRHPLSLSVDSDPTVVYDAIRRGFHIFARLKSANNRIGYLWCSETGFTAGADGCAPPQTLAFRPVRDNLSAILLKDGSLYVFAHGEENDRLLFFKGTGGPSGFAMSVQGPIGQSTAGFRRSDDECGAIWYSPNAVATARAVNHSDAEEIHVYARDNDWYNGHIRHAALPAGADASNGWHCETYNLSPSFGRLANDTGPQTLGSSPMPVYNRWRDLFDLFGKEQVGGDQPVLWRNEWSGNLNYNEWWFLRPSQELGASTDSIAMEWYQSFSAVVYRNGEANGSINVFYRRAGDEGIGQSFYQGASDGYTARTITTTRISPKSSPSAVVSEKGIFHVFAVKKDTGTLVHLSKSANSETWGEEDLGMNGSIKLSGAAASVYVPAH